MGAPQARFWMMDFGFWIAWPLGGDLKIEMRNWKLRSSEQKVGHQCVNFQIPVGSDTLPYIWPRQCLSQHSWQQSDRYLPSFGDSFTLLVWP